jgi:hypothetical protein
MKRAFISLFVLAMPSAACADLMISVNGDLGFDEITINVSDVITVDVYNTGGTTPIDFIAYLDFYYKSEGAYSLSNPRFPWPVPGVYIVPPDTPGDFDEFEITMAWGGPEIIGPIFMVDLHRELPYKNVYVELYDNRFGYTAPVDTLVIHQVPEPATFLLLGFGGLMLRRKK